MRNKTITSLRALAKQSRNSSWIISAAFGLLAITTLLILSSRPAHAQEPSSYSPEHCEFTITFPSEPYKTRRCDDQAKQETCYDQISYTKVYGLSSTVNFRVICNPINEEVYSHYSGEVMEATLKAMTNRSVVQTFDTSFREEEHFKQAGLVGEGLSGRTSTIYIAQLWIGKTSAFSVEAELIGEAAETPDKLFSDVLRSVKFKGDGGEGKETGKKPEKKSE